MKYNSDDENFYLFQVNNETIYFWPKPKNIQRKIKNFNI